MLGAFEQLICTMSPLKFLSHVWHLIVSTHFFQIYIQCLSFCPTLTFWREKITEKNIYDCVNLVLTSVVKPMDYGLWIFALFQLFHTQKKHISALSSFHVMKDQFCSFPALCGCFSGKTWQSADSYFLPSVALTSPRCLSP